MGRGPEGEFEIDRLIYKALEQLLRRAGVEEGVSYTADALEYRIRVDVPEEVWYGFLDEFSTGANRVLDYDPATDRYTLRPRLQPRRRRQ
jgi:hypothetical protein